MTDTSEDISPQELSRREFMDRSIKAIGAFIGITMGVSAVGYLISPALQPQQEQWIKIGRSSQVQSGVPMLFTVTLNKTTGWVKSEINLAYFVYTEDAVNFIVLSNICTHLGCQTHWNSDAGNIVCPCHGGQFDVRGNVIGGPPPRPLKRAEFKMDENDNILVREV
ncbi:MAG: ubiquinol-cytochrome c reductase iron-sulfur subunit [Chloroflexota bacterium]